MTSRTPAAERVFTAQSLLDALEGVAYIVDLDGCILAIGNSNWNDFAADNGTADLTGISVVGRSIYACISGRDVRESYKTFADVITKREEASISFQYRCDAPEIRRDMRLCISPIKENNEIVALLYQSLVIAEQDRPRINLFDPAKMSAMALVPPGATITTVCSYCHDVLLVCPDSENPEAWVEPEEYYRAGGISDVWVSHGICPGCHDRLMAPRTAKPAAV